MVIKNNFEHFVAKIAILEHLSSKYNRNMPEMPPHATMNVYMFQKLHIMLILDQKTHLMATGGIFFKMGL